MTKKNKPKPVLIVSATQQKTQEETQLYNSLTQTDLSKKSWKLQMYVENKEPLPKLYNKHLNRQTLHNHDVI